jgi:ESS family glutamate:Na+ symporter
MARRGKTTLLKKPAALPVEILRGIQPDAAKQLWGAKETTYSSSIESVAFHLAIALVGAGISYAIMNLVKTLQIPFISELSIWTYCLGVMYFINLFIQKTGLGGLIDNRTKSSICGVCADYAITAAIASMPVRTVLQYAIPILFSCILGYVITFIIIAYFCGKYFDKYRTEFTVSMWGNATGVFLTGLMLLKICDPEYELPVLSEYSIGFSFTSATSFIMMPIVIGMLLRSNLTVNLITQILLFAFTLLALIFIHHIFNRRVSRIERCTEE